MENYLKIKDYATLKGITQQAIYKQIKNGQIKVKVIGGKKYVKVTQQEQDQTKKEKINKSNSNKIDNQLIELLKEQLNEKDNQIKSLLMLNANLQNQLNETTKQLEYKPKTIGQKLKTFFNKNNTNQID